MFLFLAYTVIVRLSEFRGGERFAP